MDINGRFDHIEDVLINLHSGQWFGWIDSKNKVYENLIIHDLSKKKPTKEFLENELEKQQAEYDSKQYQRDRIYPPIGDQLDALYHAGVFPKEMADKLKAVKDAHPKPE